MLFNSSLFIFGYLPITLLIFYLFAHKLGKKAAILWLFFMSCVFYGCFNINFLWMLLTLILFNYGCGSLLNMAYRKYKPNRWLLSLGILMNLAVLFYFKYANFFLENVNYIFKTNYLIGGIVLPIGISFYIFQKIAFLVDAYKGEISDYSFVDFCLFVMFFPQLIAGPVVHHSEFISQIKNKAKFELDTTEFAVGLILFTVGLCKKILIADNLALIVDPLFSASQTAVLSVLDTWSASLGFGLQVYFDFSGYSDMALGLALLFGFRLPLNFNSPYQANCIIDFWQRWNITLTRFFQSYIFVPLAMQTRGNQLAIYSVILVTMLISGLWHGASWQFALYGIVHGAYLIVNHLWRQISNVTGIVLNQYLAKLLTILSVILAFIIFRASNLQAARNILNGMFKWHDFNFINQNEILMISSLVGILLILTIIPNIQQLCYKFRPTIEEIAPQRHLKHEIALSPGLGIISALAMIGAIGYQVLNNSKLLNFIYFQF